ncbi:hypothetical protein COOONC_02653 [Cooperia oncophora]
MLHYFILLALVANTNAGIYADLLAMIGIREPPKCEAPTTPEPAAEPCVPQYPNQPQYAVAPAPPSLYPVPAPAYPIPSPPYVVHG